MPIAAFIVFVGKVSRLQTKSGELQTKIGYGINSRLFCTPKIKQQAIMTKLEKLMPVSLIVKAFCKVMKTLVEDEVVVNDVMLQLSTEMALTHKEVPRVLFLKGREEDTCIVPNEIAWIGAEGSYVCFHMANGRRVLMSGSLHSVLSQLYEGGIDYFVRIHHSHAVNLYHIKARSGNILFVGKDGLSVSNKYRKSFSNYCLVITKRV